MPKSVEGEGKRQLDPLTALKSNLISFRLDPEMLQLLATQNISGESLNETARRLLVGTLQRQLELEILHRDNAMLQGELLEFKSMFLRALPGLVTSGGQVTKEHAQEWIERKVKCSPSPPP